MMLNLRKGQLVLRKKKPCIICEQLGFSGRFHLVETCLNKNKQEKINDTNDSSTKNIEGHH